jgi:peptidoglycan/LPS O-acetylase OafA/YrhL
LDGIGRDVTDQPRSWPDAIGHGGSPAALRSERVAVGPRSHLALGRLSYLDHLRAALVALVVVHHVALIYGAIAPFYYAEPPFDDPFAYTVLGAFALTNQAWFMGTLFLLAGYFTPVSFDRRGARPFVRARLIRLGIPILVGMFVLMPLAAIGFFLMPASLTGITEPLTWSTYPELIGLGPLWFIAMLLVFDLGYAAYRSLVRESVEPSPADGSFPGYLVIGLFVVGLAAVSYVLRMVVPLGKDVDVVLPALAFPTIAYLPQYLAMFIVGIMASRRGWLEALPSSAGVVGFVAVLAALVLLFPLALTGQPFVVEFIPDASFQGGGSWPSAAYALWDSITVVGMSLAAITLFRARFNRASALGRLLAENSYAVYVIHATLLVYIAYALRDLALPALAMFVLVSVIAVPACFAVAWLIRRIPLVAKVL